jgi:uncharacterized protein (TIGR02246 family)
MQNAVQKITQNDEQEIRDLVANWLSASKVGDMEKVLSLMADDVVFLVAGHPPMRGKAAFSSAQAGLADIEMDATSEIQEIRVLGDWAYLWTNLNVTMKPKKGGAAIKRAGNTLSILKKQNEAWVIFRDANMLVPVSE